MTEATSPAEVVEWLEARAAVCDHNARLCKMNDYETERRLLHAEAADLRAAASLIRELTEREKVWREADKLLVFAEYDLHHAYMVVRSIEDSERFERTRDKIRAYRAAKLVEPQ